MKKNRQKSAVRFLTDFWIYLSDLWLFKADFMARIVCDRKYVIYEQKIGMLILADFAKIGIPILK